MQLPVQREVAFKVLRAELQGSDQGQDRFAREARAVSKLSHPNIITMHDFGVDSNGHPFMAMEYAPGMSLAQWIAQPGLKFDRISHVFRQILSALSEAHEQGIVHRDLKPENLIVTRTGADEDYIKLLDFGIARMVHDGATRGLTKEGEVFGTPHYMAPEQAQGKKNIGPPADVYALGIMLYEMLVGQCPFDAPTPLSILYMHINDDLPDLDPRAGLTVPPAVRELIDRATAKSADDRYPTAAEMLVAFDHAVGNIEGKYVAPAGSSSERINVTQNMGSQNIAGQKPDDPPLAKKATADTLNFEDKPAQHITDSSNAVAIQDPQQNHSTTAALAALQPSSAKKLAVVLAVLVAVGGLGVFVFWGDDSNGVEATEQAASATDSKQDDQDQARQTEQENAPVVDGQAPADEQAPSKAGEVAASDTQEPADEPAGDQNTASSEGQAEPAPIDSDTADSDTAKPKTTNKAATNKSKPEKSKTAATDDKSDRTANPPKTRPTKTVEDTANNASASEPGTDDEAEGDDAPQKFQPKKFKPKSDSDKDEPEKFEPKKWR
jgi:serine/threonine protein kinase